MPKSSSVRSGMFGLGLALGTLDLFKLVDLGSLAVTGTTNAVGKELLKVRIAHVGRTPVEETDVGYSTVGDSTRRGWRDCDTNGNGSTEQ